jgi:endonuclease G
MKKLLLTLTALIGLVSALPAGAWTQRPNFPPQQCSALVPWGIPQVAKASATMICRQGYFSLFDNQAKIPVWGAWTVTPQTVNGCVARSNAFAADQSIPASATPQDYAGTGYDKGHNANDAHQSFDQQVEYESFLMTNMMPQLPGLNRGIWKLLETATGAWTFDTQGPVVVYSGPIYNVAKDKKIGNGVDVPYGFYKIVYISKTNTLLAFLFPHKENQGNDLTVVQTTVKDVEDNTGIVFPIPPGHIKTVKEVMPPVNFANVAAAKKKLCGRAD